MIPALSISEPELVDQPSKIWKLDLEKGCFSGTVDGLEAVAQSALMALQTQRYQYLIFSHQYGSELETLVDMDPDYIFSEGKRMIEDTLRADQRVLDVRDFTFHDHIIGFTLDTIFGTTILDTGGVRLEKL